MATRKTARKPTHQREDERLTRYRPKIDDRTRVNVYLSADEHAKIKAAAKATKSTVSGYMADAAYEAAKATLTNQK
jgi:uncharacterized protein (DUF1778 family)